MSQNIEASISLKDQMTPTLNKIEKELKELEKTMDKSTKSMSQDMKDLKVSNEGLGQGVKGLSSKFLSLKTAIVGVAGVMAFKLAKASIMASAEMETLTTQFEALFKSSEKAKQRMEELSVFASETPFELQGIAKASKILQTFGGDLLATGDGLRLVGDASAFANQPIEELSIWIGRAYDGLKANRPIGEAMARLQELALVSGQTRAEIEELQKQGKNREAWDVLQTELEKSKGGMKKLSQTTEGLLSTLGDELKMALVDIGDEFQGDFKEGLRDSIELVKELGKVGVTTAQIIREITGLKAFSELGKISDMESVTKGFDEVVRVNKLLEQARKGELKDRVNMGQLLQDRNKLQKEFLEVNAKSQNQLTNYQLTQLGFWDKEQEHYTKIKEAKKTLQADFENSGAKPTAQDKKSAKVEQAMIEGQELEMIYAKAEESKRQREFAEAEYQKLKEKWAEQDRKEADQKLEAIFNEQEAKKRAFQEELGQQVALMELEEQRLKNQQMAIGGLGQLSSALSRAFAKNKEMAYADAIIQGALAMQKAWASAPYPYNIPSVLATGVATASNIATISNTKYEKGGAVYGARHGHGGVNAELEGGEFVLSRRDVANMGGFSNVQAMRNGADKNYSFNNTFNVTISGDNQNKSLVSMLEKEVNQFARFFKESVVERNYNTGLVRG